MRSRSRRRNHCPEIRSGPRTRSRRMKPTTTKFADQTHLRDCERKITIKRQYKSLLALVCVITALTTLKSQASIDDPRTRKIVEEGLDYLAYNQHKLGHWTAQGRYPTAMTALAGMALLSEGSTATQGKYADNIGRAVDYLVHQSRPNGLIGDPVRDDRYTYGHGFSMLFLSQV